MKLSNSLLVAITTIAACCTPAGNNSNNTTTDLTLPADTTTQDVQQYPAVTPMPVPQASAGNNIPIAYYSEAYGVGQQFEPFRRVYNIARYAVRTRDSLYFTGDEGKLTTADSTVFMPAMKKAIQEIEKYADELRPGLKPARGKSPVYKVNDSQGDESHNLLRGSESKLLDNADFMFLGAAPFMYEDPELYKDPDGNPEARYIVDIPDNGQYFFNYLYSRHPGPVELSYGPPFFTHEGMDVNFNGVGSIIHNLKTRIPVSILTTIGIIPGSLVSVEMRLGEGPGCTSSFPKYTFACPKNINPKSIFGVLYCDKTLISANAINTTEPGGAWWLYDIDGDTQPEFMRVESVTAGASSDELAVAIWYVMLNGKWVVVEYGDQPDCT